MIITEPGPEEELLNWSMNYLFKNGWILTHIFQEYKYFVDKKDTII